jgi:hypothetical protein
MLRDGETEIFYNSGHEKGEWLLLLFYIFGFNLCIHSVGCNKIEIQPAWTLRSTFNLNDWACKTGGQQCNADTGRITFRNIIIQWEMKSDNCEIRDGIYYGINDSEEPSVLDLIYTVTIQ